MNLFFMLRLVGVLATGLICCSCTSSQPSGFQTYDPTSNQVGGAIPANGIARQHLATTHLKESASATAKPGPRERPPTGSTNRMAEFTAEKAAPPIVKGSSSGKTRLAPGDVLELKVYQEEELNSRVRIDGEGMLTLPLVGSISVGGKTLEEARLIIRDRLAKDYLFNPHVSLIVTEFAKRRFSVLGEVKMPGFYSIPENENLNLLQALSMAGGYTTFANGSRIRVKRVVNGAETILRVDAAAMAKQKDVKVLEIQAEDAIEVGASIF